MPLLARVNLLRRRNAHGTYVTYVCACCMCGMPLNTFTALNTLHYTIAYYTNHTYYTYYTTLLGRRGQAAAADMQVERSNALVVATRRGRRERRGQ